MHKLLLLNGPNLNMLASRQPEIYGNTSLADVVDEASAVATKLGMELSHVQSNHEGELIDVIQACKQDFIIINAGALTHTSIGIRDALLAVAIPFIEVHISNVYQREDFRKQSYLSDIAAGIIIGFGKNSYELAVHAAHNKLNSKI